jgi:hypothetical protein
VKAPSFLGSDQEEAGCEDQVPADNKRDNDPGRKLKYGMAADMSDRRHGDEEAEAKKHSATPNRYRLPIHSFFYSG